MRPPGGINAPQLTAAEISAITDPVVGKLIYNSDTGEFTYWDGAAWQTLSIGAGAYIPIAEKGAANGVATLDATARLPFGQLPTSAMEYKGAYDILTNTPTLADGTGTNGDFYRCSTAGSRDFGSGSITVGIGDTLIYDGSVWQRIPADDSVQSVNTQTGVVVLDPDDLDDSATTHKFVSQAQIDEFHTQDTDQALDYGGANQVTAAQAKAAYTHSQVTSGNPHQTDFLELPDAPSSFSGEKHEFLKVNDGETALIYAGRGHWGSQTKANMEAISGARVGDSCWCTTFGKMFYYDGNCWIVPGEVVRVENRSGGSLVEGDVVANDSANSRAAVTTTTLDDNNVMGPVVTGGPSGAGNWITVAVNGLPWKVLMRGSVNIGDFIFAYSTAKQGYATAGSYSGSFGETLESKGPVGTALLDCWIISKEVY